jgi:hypothetical protein
MANDILKLSGATKASRPDRGGGIIKSEAVIGVVKDNIDTVRMGRVRVYLADFSGTDPDDSNNWVTVSYLSPFYGLTPSTSSGSGHGDFVGNPHSYGMWASAPDIGTKVVCIFINGDINYGYYIGCVPEPESLHMVPAIGASDKIVPNEGEADSYGGAPRLPVTNINTNNSGLNNSSDFLNQGKPVHSTVAATLNTQGLIRDPVRGVIGSTAQRESPSRVFGISTPGRPIYEGGFTDQNIASSGDAPPEQLKVVARRGGHSLVMDDGDIAGRDQLTRLRTSTGHQILMHDTSQTLFIIHANGQSWIELGKEGTIDMYSTNSVNIRTQGDLNLHADRNINMHAAKQFNLQAEQINIESVKDTNFRVGTDYKHYVMGKFTVKVDGAMSMNAGGEAGYASASTTYINGSKVNLNTGSASLTPEAVKPIPIVKHTDTLYDDAKGYAAAPGKLDSITSRAPAHQPWANGNQGVDVKVSLSASANLPSAPAPKLAAAVAAAPAIPDAPVSTAVVSTVPTSVAAVGGSLDTAVTSAVVAQNAMSAAASAATGAATGAIGSLGQTATQLASSAAGIIKPGADVLVNKALAEGKSLTTALPTNLFTGKDGITSVTSLVNNVGAQVTAQVNMMKDSVTKLTQAGAITGKESAGSLAGIVNTAVGAGVKAATDLVKGVTGAVGNVASSVKNLMSGGSFAAGIGEKVTGGLNSISSSLSSIGKSIGGAIDSAKGVVAGAFDKVTANFGQLKAGVPQNLAGKDSVEAAKEIRPAFITDPNTGETVRNFSEADLAAMKSNNASINASLTNALGMGAGGAGSNLLASAGSAISGATSGLAGAAGGISGIGDTVGGALKSVTAAAGAAVKSVGASISSVGSGLDALPGGMSAVNNVVNNATGALNKIPGTGAITAAASQAMGAVNGALGAVNGALGSVSALGDKAKGLMESASAGLDPAALAELNSAVASMGSGVKLPTVALNTTDTAGIAAQTASLLGNPKIPAINFGTPIGAVNTSFNAASNDYNKVNAELQQAKDDNFEFRKVYFDLKAEKGPDDSGTTAAYDAWKANEQKIASLQQQVAAASKAALSKLA